jgi:hypothetical protein
MEAKPVYVRIPVPRISSELLANLLGLAGLVGLVVAVGGLTRNVWWSVLLASVILVGVSFVQANGSVVPGPADKGTAQPAGANLAAGRRAA